MRVKEIPVYLFTGFLESGKTKFIQSTLEDQRFNTGEKTLLLVCEEGEEEYEPESFYGKNVHIKIMTEKNEMTEANLNAWAREIRAERVVVEYNGMWLVNEFFEAMPENWAVYQVMFTADATTFIQYNSNMRSLVVDKLNICQLIAFNRVGKDFDKAELHKIVRGISRRTDIVYEYPDGSTEFDEIVDPLPFDVNADIIEVQDKDYALLYRDIMENPRQYDGKTLKYKGIVSRNKKLSDGTFVCGRHVMTCCVQDITYCCMVAHWEGTETLANAQWIWLTAKVSIKFSKIYGGKGPILTVIKAEPADPPAETVATFY